LKKLIALEKLHKMKEIFEQTEAFMVKLEKESG
jgi:hypothetical protein